jgi:spermidine synthase
MRPQPADPAFKHLPLLLDLAAFVSGAATLAVEFAASRLVANVFSASNVVWAGVIGMTLFYLMLGYFVGGRWADRAPSPATFYGLLAWTALGVGAMPVAALPILRLAANALQYFDLASALASALGIAVLFSAPVTLLGCIPPFIIRLAVRRVSRSGQTAGRVYALSTAGGLAGTFGTVLALIPWIGSPATFIAFAGALMLMGLAGLWLSDRARAARALWLPLALIALAAFGLRRPLKPPPPNSTLLYERETPYNYVQVVEANQTRYLLINETLAVHSVYHPTQLITNGSWDYFVAAPYFNAPPYAPARVQKAAVLGLAAGTVARQFAEVYGPIQVDGVEIDPGVVAAGREYFGMTMPNLNVIVDDARFALTRLGGGYQIIGVDAYRPPYIPWQLTTREFFTEVSAHLAGDGVVIINVGRTQADRRLVEAMTATLLQVFPSVHTMDVPESFNTMLVATLRPTTADNLRANASALGPDAHPFLKYSLELSERTLRPTAASGPVFTDDRAPVEFIADSLVLRFALEGGAVQFPVQP